MAPVNNEHLIYKQSTFFFMKPACTSTKSTCWLLAAFLQAWAYNFFWSSSVLGEPLNWKENYVHIPSTKIQMFTIGTQYERFVAKTDLKVDRCVHFMSNFKRSVTNKLTYQCHLEHSQFLHFHLVTNKHMYYTYFMAFNVSMPLSSNLFA